MKLFILSLILTPIVYSQNLPKFELKCSEAFLDGMLIRRFNDQWEVPVKIYTREDVRNGDAYPYEVGFLGGKKVVNFNEWIITATISKEFPRLLIEHPSGLKSFNEEASKDYSGLGIFPNFGKSMHKLTCSIQKI